ncbi:DUF3429 superfamily domain containing protein [Histoplasma capsulatum]|uniref:DUF3429 superfamily domain containing protein n=1 Tax=Ajellomyces capsulatus TaxID=5037 RepID=A0A8A1M4V6_AJECA|nr:conserved hypothetical protein [Histoplasma mississippiense (nom. inval.)]EDN03683.1 conserved hypothetical protein [Histoplasma mississippiense (nom. inval.)]QSS60645.1 DUF3429 superfamily domain containing protein [Histoplasma capsulatum]
MFFRTAVTRSILRAASSSNVSTTRLALSGTIFKAQLTSSVRQPAVIHATSLAVAARKPTTTALIRYASTAAVKTSDAVPPPKVEEEEDVDMMAGVKGDMKIIRDTFSLKDVPKEALYLGLAGVIPYVATSLQTVYLSWEMNNAITTGSGHYISGQTAEMMMSLIEPVQVGYGAVILSFLGAIHWGLEWAGYGGKVGYRRYATGVVAPAVAWPTLFMPIEYALISQFFAFTFLYYNDARSAVKGWTPSWYHMYRFVLTFIVGASIVMSLVGRENLSTHYESRNELTKKWKELERLAMEKEAVKATESSEEQ